MDRDDRLEEILCEWLDRRDRGVETDPDELVRDHPDLADQLTERLDALRFVDAALSRSSPVAEGTPEEIGEYRIVREIGRGGMGVVYEAEQTSMGRRVALKVLSPSVTCAAQAVQRFQREARATGKLRHTNIVPVYGMGSDRGLHYYAMELVEGRSLGDVVTEMKAGEEETAPEDGPLGTTTHGREHYVRLAEMVAGVAEALHAAHEEGIVHRDVKPTNLLLAPDGSLKLVDFGLARLAGEGASMTATGQILGTPHYMSPEQAMARKIPIDYRTDIYSLGATLYEALTLKIPFTGDSLPAVCSAIISKEPPSLRKVNPRIPRDLETIVLKAMEKERERRYASAEEMARDLRRFAAGVPILARRVGPAARAWRTVRRNKIRTALVAAVVLLAGLGAYLAQHGAEEGARRMELEYERLIARAEEAVAASNAAFDRDEDLPLAENASDILTRAIELVPERPEAYWHRSLAPGRTLEERFEDVERAALRGLAESSVHLLRACLLHKEGRYREEEEEKKLAAAHPDDDSPLGLYARAWLRAADRKPLEAIELFTRVIEDPRAGTGVLWLSTHLRASQRLETADWSGALDDFLALKRLGDDGFRIRIRIASIWMTGPGGRG